LPADDGGRHTRRHRQRNAGRPDHGETRVGLPAAGRAGRIAASLDYEKDDYDTPRIAGVVGEESYIGIVRRDAVLVEAVEEPTLVATYEKDAPEPTELEATDAPAMAAELYDREFEHPVCAAAIAADGEGFSTGQYNGDQ